RGDHRLDLRGPAHVRGECRGPAAFAGNDVDRLLRRLAVAVDAKHLRALARERHRGRLAVAPARPDRAGADHHRCLAAEAWHSRSPPQHTIVIPGCAPLGAGPESITTIGGYGFRARAPRAPE